MTIADVKSGGWADHEVLTHGQMNLIRSELLKAVDGVGGGTYTLSAPLRFQSALVRVDDLQVDDDAVVTGDLTLNGSLDVNATWRFDGQGEFNDDVNVNDRWVFRSGGQTEFKAGNTAIFFSLDDLTIGSPFVSQSMRVPLVPFYNTRDVAGFQEEFKLDISTGGWLNQVLGTSLFFMLPLMAGDVLTSVSAIVVGNPFGSHGADPAQPMRLRVYETGDPTGAWTAIATQVDAASGAFYDAPHVLTASTGGYTALDNHYVIEWRAEASTNALSGANLLTNLRALVTRKRLISGNTFGS